MPSLTVEIGAILNGTFNARINTAIRSISSMRAVTSALNTTMLKALNTSRLLESSTKRLGTAMEKVSKNVKSYNGSLRSARQEAAVYTRAISGLSNAQHSAANATYRARMEQQRLEAQMRRTTSAARQQSQVRPPRLPGSPAASRARANRSGGGNAFNTVAGVAASVGAGALGMSSLRNSGSLDSAARRIAITAEAGDPVAEALSIKKTLEGLSRRGETNLGTTDLAAMLNTYVSSNVDLSTAKAIQKSTGRAAYAYGTTGEEMAQLGVALSNQLKIPVTEVAKAFDILALAGKEGAFELDDMAANFPEVGSAAALFGQRGLQGTAELGAFLQEVMKSTKSASAASAYSADFLGKVMAPETNKNFSESAGLADEQALAKFILSKSKAGQNPLIPTLEFIKKASKGGDALKIGEMFRDTQVRAAVVAGIRGLDQIKATTARSMSAKSTGMVDRDFAVMASGEGGALDASANTLQRISQSIGTILAQSGVVEIFSKIADAASRNPDVAKFAVGLGAVALALGPIASALSIFSGIAGLFGAGGTLATLGISLGGIATSLAAAAGPITLIVAGVAAAGAVIYKYWEPIQAIVEGIRLAFSDTFSYLLESAGPFKQFWEIGVANIKSAWEWLKKFIVPVKMTSQEMSALTQSVRDVAGTVMKTVSGPLKAMLEVFRWIWNISRPLRELLVDYFFPALGAIATYVWENKLKPVFDGIRTAISWLIANGSMVGDVMRRAFESILPALSTVLSTVTKVWDSVKGIFATMDDNTAMQVEGVRSKMMMGGAWVDDAGRDYLNQNRVLELINANALTAKELTAVRDNNTALGMYSGLQDDQLHGLGRMIEAALKHEAESKKGGNVTVGDIHVNVDGKGKDGKAIGWGIFDAFRQQLADRGVMTSASP